MDKTVFAYNNCASAYEEKISTNEVYRKHIVSFSSLFNKGDTILDIGCGPGINSALFTEKGLSVTGIDSSEEMIKLASKNCPEGLFFNSSAAEISTDNVFDGLCLSFVIVHMNDSSTENLIKRLSAMIKKNGKVYISFMTGKQPGYEYTSFSQNQIFFNYYDKEKIIKLFENCGFKLISSHSDPYEEADGSFTDDIFLIFNNIG